MKAAFAALAMSLLTQTIADKQTCAECTFSGNIPPIPPATCQTVLGGCINGLHHYNIFHLSWPECQRLVEEAKLAGGGGGTCI